MVAVGGIAVGGGPAGAVASALRPAGPSLLGFGTATVTPDSGLRNGQVVTVTASGFGTATTLYAVECAPQAIAATDHGRWCDLTDAATSPATNGAATFPVTIRTGGAFHASASGAACGFFHNNSKCYLIVADSLTLAQAQYVYYPAIWFRDPRIVTTTVIAPSRRTVVSGAVVTMTARTTHATGSAALRGSVAFTDNGSTFASVRENATGKVTAKLKMLRTGKHRITARYSGDGAYRPSAGWSIVVVKR